MLLVTPVLFQLWQNNLCCIWKCSSSIKTGCDIHIYVHTFCLRCLPVHGVLFSKCSATHHCKEVVIALDLGGHLWELLVESIRDVVSGISGDDEDTLPDCSKLDGQTTARREKRHMRGLKSRKRTTKTCFTSCLQQLLHKHSDSVFTTEHLDSARWLKVNLMNASNCVTFTFLHLIVFTRVDTISTSQWLQ